MSERPPSDETLMAYADGMLETAERRRVEAAIQRDPALAARVESFRETARRVSDWGRAQDDHVPDGLVAHLRDLAAQSGAGSGVSAAQKSDRTVVDLPLRRRAVPVWQLPLAASIFLAIGLWAGTRIAPDPLLDEPDAAQMAVLDSPALHDVLRSAASGQSHALEGGGQVTLVASFANGDGQFCREFELDWPQRPSVVSVACHAPETDPDGWAMQLAVLTSGAGDQDYVPASSLETLDAYLAAIGAGPPLSPEDEAAALNRLN